MNARNHNFTEQHADPFFEIAPPFPNKSAFGPGRHFVSAWPDDEAFVHRTGDHAITSKSTAQERIDAHADAFMRTMRWGDYKRSAVSK